jgi:hypothetical protein
MLLLGAGAGRAQDARPAESLRTLASSHEKVKAYGLAARTYLEAGRAFEAEAATYKTDGAVRARLRSAQMAFAKAQGMFRLAKDAASEAFAAREARRLRERLNADPVGDAAPGGESSAPAASLAGGPVILRCRLTNFSLQLPPAVRQRVPVAHTRATLPMLREREAQVSLVDPGVVPRFSFTLLEYAGDEGPRTITDLCEEMARQFKEPGANLTGATQTRLVEVGGGVQACLTTKESRQVDTKMATFGFEMTFFHRKAGYRFVGTGPGAWSAEMKAMLASFRITDAEPVPARNDECGGSDTRPVPALAFEDTWMLPDPSGVLRITLSPNLPRTRVPAAWHDLIGATRRAVGEIEGLSAKLEHQEEKGLELEVLECIVDTLEIPQITPGQLADAYLSVLDKVVTAVAGLEGRISGLTVDLTFELPYWEVRTACIPRFRCVKGRWERDLGNMDFEQLSKSRRVDRKVYRNLSPGLVRQKEAELRAIPERLASHARKVADGECGQHRHKLAGLAWPPSPGSCDLIEGRLARLRAQADREAAGVLEARQALQAEVQSRPGRLAEATREVERLRRELQEARQALERARTERRNLELNRANLESERYRTLMAAVDLKVQEADQRKEALDADLDAARRRQALLESGRAEADLARRFKAQEAELARLRVDATRTEAEIQDCRRKERAGRKP